jgi:hypothetical protein
MAIASFAIPITIKNTPNLNNILYTDEQLCYIHLERRAFAPLI